MPKQESLLAALLAPVPVAVLPVQALLELAQSLLLGAASAVSGAACAGAIKASNLCILCSKIPFNSWNRASSSRRTAVGIPFGGIVNLVVS